MRLSYSGDISETVVFDLTKAEQNLKALRRLLEGLGRYEQGGREGGYLWVNVGTDKILEFLSHYDAGGAPRANPALWSQYIQRQNEQHELTDWSMLIASSGLSTATSLDQTFGGMEIGAIKRHSNGTTEERHTIGRLVNPSDELRDLDVDERKKALDRTRELWEKDTRKNKASEPPSDPSGKGIRYARPKVRGMLLVYPLDTTAIENEQWRPEIPLVGVAISFPESDSAKDISYVVTGKYAEDADFGDF